MIAHRTSRSWAWPTRQSGADISPSERRLLLFLPLFRPFGFLDALRSDETSEFDGQRTRFLLCVRDSRVALRLGLSSVYVSDTCPHRAEFVVTWADGGLSWELSPVVHRHPHQPVDGRIALDVALCFDVAFTVFLSYFR